MGAPPGSRGYRYRGAGTPSDPFRAIVVTPRVVKLVASDDGTLDGPVGEVQIDLHLGVMPFGGQGDTYCARFGGTTVGNETGVVRRRGAPPAPACTHGDPP